MLLALKRSWLASGHQRRDSAWKVAKFWSQLWSKSSTNPLNLELNLLLWECLIVVAWMSWLTSVANLWVKSSRSSLLSKPLMMWVKQSKILLQLVFKMKFFMLAGFRWRQIPFGYLHRALEQSDKQEHPFGRCGKSISLGSCWSHCTRKNSCRAVLSRRWRRQESEYLKKKNNFWLISKILKKKWQLQLTMCFTSGHVNTASRWRSFLWSRSCLWDYASFRFARLHHARNHSHCR